MRIVIDTNVLVSGLLNPNGPPGQIIDLLLAGKVQAQFDDRIMGEYAEVLERPQLAIDPASIKAVLGHIRLVGNQVTGLPLPETLLPDPDDLPFAEVAVSAQADALVTGNMRHFAPLLEKGVKVYSPAQFVEWLAGLP